MVKPVSVFYRNDFYVAEPLFRAASGAAVQDGKDRTGDPGLPRRWRLGMKETVGGGRLA